MLFQIFDSIPDHRVTGRCTYSLSDLLTIALLTFMSGGEDYVDMSLFAEVKARKFGLLAHCDDRSPSPDTFERLMSAVSPDEIERCLVYHGRAFIDSLKEKQVVIDGKKLVTKTKTSDSVKNTLRYKKSFKVRATAYSGGGYCANGKRVKVGRIAVDPSVIPLGTWMYVKGYGLCQACDTGGAIKGRKIDVYFNKESKCNRWGVRGTKVYILK